MITYEIAYSILQGAYAAQSAFSNSYGAVWDKKDRKFGIFQGSTPVVRICEKGVDTYEMFMNECAPLTKNELYVIIKAFNDVTGYNVRNIWNLMKRIDSKAKLHSNKTINIKPSTIYTMPLGDGYLEITASPDPNYPGLDIEYISNKPQQNECISRPRVLIEIPMEDEAPDQNKLRALIWGNRKKEDYTDKIIFKD